MKSRFSLVRGVSDGKGVRFELESNTVLQSGAVSWLRWAVQQLCSPHT